MTKYYRAAPGTSAPEIREAITKIEDPMTREALANAFEYAFTTGNLALSNYKLIMLLDKDVKELKEGS